VIPTLSVNPFLRDVSVGLRYLHGDRVDCGQLPRYVGGYLVSPTRIEPATSSSLHRTRAQNGREREPAAKSYCVCACSCPPVHGRASSLTPARSSARVTVRCMAGCPQAGFDPPRTRGCPAT
jgi:hypothetical protein